jgi:hypothetical protein
LQKAVLLRLTARFAWLLPAAGLAVILRGFWLGQVPVERDWLRFEMPVKRFIADALAAGHLPTWWPYDGLGVPFLSSPNVTFFHPTTLLFWALPFTLAFVLHVLVGPVVGAWGTYRLARSLGVRPAAAPLAVAFFLLNGWAVSLLEQTPFALAAAAVPWAYWAALRLHKSAVAVVVLALAVASTLLAGDAVMAYTAALGSLALAAGKRRRLRRFGRYAQAMVLAAAVAMAQLLPTLALFNESPRSQGRGLLPPSFWNLGPAQLLEFVHPSPFIDAIRSQYFPTLYVGLVFLPLILIGAATSFRMRNRLLAIAAVALVTAAGSSTPLWSLWSAVLPGWKGLQFPIKAVGGFYLVGAILAARGAQRLLQARWSAPRHSWLAAALVGLAVLDNSLALFDAVPTAPASFLEPRPLAVAMQKLGVSTVGTSFTQTWKQERAVWGEVGEAEFLGAVYPLSNVFYGLPTANAYLPAFSMRYQELAVEHQGEWVSRLAGVFGSQFMVIRQEQLRPEQYSRIRERDAVSGAVLYELRQHLPRAYLTHGARVLPRAQALAHVLSKDFKPGREAVLESDGPWAAPASLSGDSEQPAVPLTEVSREGNALIIRLETTAAALLVVNESMFSGVSATDNGQATPVWVANYLVRAVQIQPGKHEVRFEYQPPGLRAGLVISALGLVACAALVLWPLRQKLPRRFSRA